MATLHIPPWDLRKRKSWTVIGLFYVPMDLHSLYWIPKLHKCPFEQRYIAGSAKFYTKPLSKLSTCIISVIKTGLQSYYDTSYARAGVNEIWILKNTKDLSEYMQYRSLSSCNRTKTFDFSTLYTTIPYSTLKDRLRELVQLWKRMVNVDTNTLC